MIPNCIYAWFLGIRWDAFLDVIQYLIAQLGYALLVLFLALCSQLILPLIFGDISLVMEFETGTLNKLVSAYAYLKNVFYATSEYLLVGCCLTGYISTLYMIVTLGPRSYVNRNCFKRRDGWYRFSWFPNGKVGLLNENGVLVFLPEYDEIDESSEGLCAVKIDNKWGYIRLRKDFEIDWVEGPWILPQYSYAGPFTGGLAEVRSEFHREKGWRDCKGYEYWDMTEDEARKKMKNR